jgi:hypothetical protein
MSRPPHPPWCNHPNNIRWGILAVKFLPSRSGYLPQHSVLRNFQYVLLPQTERPSFAPIQHNRQNYSFVYFNL